MIITTATPEDAPNLVVLKQQVWVATYAIEGIRQEFSDYLLQTFTLENERSILLSPGKKTLIAEKDDHLIACAVIDYQAPAPIPEVKGLPEITVLYVLESFEGKGIGKMLLKRALNDVKQQGYRGAWLSVYHKNTHAIEFYLRQGFSSVGVMNFEMVGNKYPNEIMIYKVKA